MRPVRPLEIGIKITSKNIVLREHIFKPLLAGVAQTELEQSPKQPTPLISITSSREQMTKTFSLLGLAA